MVQEDPPLLLIDSLTPILHRLLRFNPEVNSNVVLQLLMDRHEEFQQISQRRGGRGKYMGLDSVRIYTSAFCLFVCFNPLNLTELYPICIGSHYIIASEHS